MFEKSTAVAMGDEKGTCIEIGLLADLVANGGFNFTSRRAPKDEITSAGAPPGLSPGELGYRTLSGVEQKFAVDFRGRKLPVAELTTKELVLLVRAKLGGNANDYPLQNSWLKSRSAQIVTPLAVSTGDCLTLTAVDHPLPLTCSPRTRLCLANGAGYVYADEVERESVLDTYYGPRRIKTLGPANSTLDVIRTTGELVDVRLWTGHCLLANGFWCLTD